MKSQKLFLIDAYALIYRSYFAFIKNPRVTSKGMNTSAIFGFANTLLELISSEKPDYLAIGFDLSQPTFRHQLYSDYKAHREETPEGIKLAVPYIRQFAQAMRIPIIEQIGYEADDVIGTIAKSAAKEGFDVYIMTPDKDYGQLVEENIKIYKPRTFGSGFEVLGQEEICGKYGITTPMQLIDILAMWGDAADNIKGIEGVGEKTATKLIAEYGSIEGIYQNIDSLKGKLKIKFENGVETVKLAKELVTIITNVETPFSFADMKFSEPDMAAVDNLFNELEFTTLKQRLRTKLSVPQVSIQGTLWDVNPESAKMFEDATSYKTLTDFEHKYTLIDTKQSLSDLVIQLDKARRFSFDTETTGLDPLEARIVGVSFCISEGNAFYVTVNNELSDNCIADSIKPLLENTQNIVIGQNLKYDILVLKKYDVHIHAKIIDTMLAHYLIEPEQKHNIDYLALHYLNWQKISTESLIGKKKGQQLSMATIAPQVVCNYACEDADVTLRLWNIFEKEIDQLNLRNIFEKVEMPLINVLADMESTGVSLDIKELNSLSSIYQDEVKRIEQKIYDFAGYTFNIASPKQLGELLFARLKITDKPKLTKTKQYATGEDVLLDLKDKHEIIPLILEYRELQKLLNTYIDVLPKLVNPRTNKIHTSYNQAVTNTGRLSSANPNLQNIPIRDERGKAIRRAFLPSSDQNVLLAADYSQIELRIMAHLSQDENMISAFDSDMDIHQDTAAKLFGIPLEEVTREQRGQAKGANFGIIYGISSYGLAQNTGLSNKDAKILIDNYFKTFPKVKKYMEESIRSCREKGFVQTIMGRKKFLKDIVSSNSIVRGGAERNAINAPIQGSSADMIKLSMINIWDKFKEQKLTSKMILQVHDELVFDVPVQELEVVKNIVEKEMLNALVLNVKLKVDIKSGKNWLEAH